MNIVVGVTGMSESSSTADGVVVIFAVIVLLGLKYVGEVLYGA